MPRWADFDESERWSLLNLEPPDHTRIRRLITKVFTPSAVGTPTDDRGDGRPAAAPAAVEARTFDLLADYAQPYSVAVICSMLGVPARDTPRLLDWSHASSRCTS
jgi:cytochrome P450